MSSFPGASTYLKVDSKVADGAPFELLWLWQNAKTDLSLWSEGVVWTARGARVSEFCLIFDIQVSPKWFGQGFVGEVKDATCMEVKNTSFSRCESIVYLLCGGTQIPGNKGF